MFFGKIEEETHLEMGLHLIALYSVRACVRVCVCVFMFEGFCGDSVVISTYFGGLAVRPKLFCKSITIFVYHLFCLWFFGTENMF